MLRRIILLAAFLASPAVWAQTWVQSTGTAADFALAGPAGAARIVVAPTDAKVVGHAVRDLAADIARVSGRAPALFTAKDAGAGAPAVLVGTLGKSPIADALAAGGKLDLSALRGTWESFVIATVDQPLPGVPRALAIIGSDPRGTAFGVYELSQAIGVSPWTWWADVAPARRDALYVKAGLRRSGPPSVKYRGIFINDEDWGLRQWAAHTYEPEHGNIGPKTYTRIFELLLRLKANTLWPAMHPGTRPFNSFPENAALADEYGIVMGSSHAEPMLRNNVGEWTDAPDRYNYATNGEGMRRYWEERVAANGKYENIYTIGTRGIHDGAMQGPKAVPERVALLQRIFADQRALLAKHVNPQVDKVPQLFVPYKEVLAQYQAGMQVPDDVTLMWTDDNFGYVRSFTTPAERTRAGGFGVYYHVSYLGAPLSYLWLNTTPPSLIWEEMKRSYDAGADRIWILNVGDLKPAEIGTEFFLQMAWDIGRWRPDNLPDFLKTWAAREFGTAMADDIAAIMNDYYRLNFQRRPEHLQWWLPKEQPRRSPMTPAQADARRRAFADLRRRVDALAPAIPVASRDAWFELVAYPAQASALANARFLAGERGDRDAAEAADAALQKLTAHWDGGLAGGKWKHIMAESLPAGEWPSFRTARWTMPAYPLQPPATPTAAADTVLEAEHFDGQRKAGAASWQAVPGLGTSGSGAVVLVAPGGAGIAPERAAADAPRLDYNLHLAQGGMLTVRAQLLPTHPGAGKLRFALALDDGGPQIVEMANRDGGAEWAEGVLNNARMVTASLGWAAAGGHVLRLYAIDPGVVVDTLAVGTAGP
ncbi:glycosyl hydrolase 115 family protein [Massilia phyllosphaerae]|uniref:glycosyl hydrolase 115 family protein n=1 Tax=Massilia phyllosphaerae TaxID=3106034 RepID=UPI002B1CB279|nr:glycosyl hydrolase 115 family protein [Massilia sp. SGZ-792]